MKVLVIGGSVFLGRAVVSESQALGADVTIFNRGLSGPAPAGVRHVRGDRTVTADLAQVAGQHFDVVVDTCGYVPVDVARSAGILASTCGRYVFVSTVNVFPGWPEATDYHTGGVYQGDPDATGAAAPVGLADGQEYGWLKAGCELAAIRAFGPTRTSVLRAGSLVGPHDSATGRLPWWIARIARGGEVLVPGAPADPMSLIDARDLARFAVRGVPGVFETGGPSGPAVGTRAELMTVCQAVTGSAVRFTYVGDDWLAAQEVEPWTEMPLWSPAAPSLFAHHGGAAEAAGLRWRPLAETVADTWAWLRSLPGGWQAAPRTPGLPADREVGLLAAWHTR